MPRKKGEKRKYNEDDIIQAVANIQNKSMTYREASDSFKVPMATLCDRIKQRFPLNPGRPGEFNLLKITKVIYIYWRVVIGAWG